MALRATLSATTRRLPLGSRGLASALARTSNAVRSDWTRAEVQAVYDQPLLELIRDAGACHRAHWDSRDVQQCTLLSIKTGGCTEDCGCCSQSVRHKTHVKPTKQLPVEEVVESARRAKAAGSTRFCMGAAWRELGNKKKAFREILEMVSRVNAEGLEVCATLGMLNPEQAKQLKEAGLHAYNHNLDTSPDYYGEIITTRTYSDRLETLDTVRDAGMKVCSGGILGMGEGAQDRSALLQQLANSFVLVVELITGLCNQDGIIHPLSHCQQIGITEDRLRT